MELKPCPFCGCYDLIVEEIEPHTHAFATFMLDYPGSAVIVCPSDDCGAAIMARTLEAAAERWNRRANDGERMEE